MERPPILYTKTVDGLHIAYQVVGEGPFAADSGERITGFASVRDVA